MNKFYVVQDYHQGTHSASVMNTDELKELLNLFEEKPCIAKDLDEISITYYNEKIERCGNTFEIASGHTASPCELEKEHEGNCKGIILGSDCYWPSEFETEEQMHYASKL